MKRILFGGSFDPPTIGHRRLIEIAGSEFPNAELRVVVAGQAPHKLGRQRTPARQRYAMARIAFVDLPLVRVSDEEIERRGPSYTVETLARHRRELGQRRDLGFLIGGDSLLDFASWREPDRILELARVLTVARPGYAVRALSRLRGLDARQKAKLREDLLDAEGPRISSTEIRAALRRTAAIQPRIRATPPRGLEVRVFEYIERHSLYGVLR